MDHNKAYDLQTALIKVLKKRFPNLSVDEATDISQKMCNAVIEVLEK